MSFSCRAKTDHDNPPNLRKEFCTTGRFNRNSPINLLYPRVDKNEHERTVCVCVFSLSAALGSATAFSSMRKVLQQSKYKWRRSSCSFKHFVFLFPLLSRSYCSDMLYGAEHVCACSTVRSCGVRMYWKKHVSVRVREAWGVQLPAYKIFYVFFHSSLAVSTEFLLPAPRDARYVLIQHTRSYAGIRKML